MSFQEQLWIRALKAESDRRWKEAEEVGIGPFPHPVDEPRPLLSHFYGIPENVADMWDSVSAAVNIPGHLLRALGNPSGLTGGAMGPPGIPRPSEVGDPTPPLAKATAAFPEEPFRKPLMVEAATQTMEGETAWNQWLAKALVGKGLAEHGLRTSDFELSKRIAECMPPLSGARESRLRDRRNRPDSMAVMLYIVNAESSYLSYRRAPRGYSDLLGGLEAKMLQPPANVWQKEVTQAWKILEASVVFRMAGVKKRADEKKARREGRASLRSATAKAAASGSARLPSSSASSSEEEACIFPLEIEAMNHVIGVQDGRMWRFLEDMVGYSLKDWRESSNTGLAADPEPASSEGPAAISVPPSPKSPGAESMAPSVAPGMVIADVFNLPRVPSPSVFRAYGSSCPEALPAANATPGTGAGSFDSIERASNGNGSSNGICSFNGNGPNRAREEFQVAGSFADPSLDIFSFSSGGGSYCHKGDLREPYRECLPGFPNSGRGSKGSDPVGSRGPRRGEQRAGVTASRSEFLVKFPELTSGRSSGESSSIENFADVSFCQHGWMHVWHGFCSEHVSWNDGCRVVQTPSRNTKQKARNLKKPQAQNLKKPQAQNLREPSSFRSGSGFTPGVDLGILVGILMIHSLLSGLLLWGFSGLLRMFRKVVSGKRRGRRYTVLPSSCGSYLRVRLRNRWVRVEVSRKLCFERVRKGFLQGFLDHVGMLSCFGMCDMVVGDDEPSPPGTAEKLTHSLRAVRGLPSPGSGTGTDPFVLDSEPSPNIEPRNRNPEDPEGLFEDDPFGEEPASGSHKKPKTHKGEPPPEDPEGPGDEDEDMRVPLTNLSLHRHRCQGHFPFDENCTSCCSSKGRVPARRLRRKLQRENQTIGLDFYYFGKLRVLLVMHLGSRYTLSLPAPELNDDLVYNVIRSIKECGLTGKAVTFRLDNEASLVSLVDRVGRSRSCPASAVITDVVAGYRPQSKGSIEKQVDVMKSGFWSVWLDLEAQITKALPEAPAEGVKLPLGGLLWQAAVFYTSRCYNLWCCSQDNSTTALDRLHEEFVQKTRARPFGCVLQGKVSKSRAHLEKYRGARTVKIVYLGPVHARGGGIYGVPLGSKEIDVFPAAGLGKGGDVFDAGTLVELASEQPLIQDNQDPERPILFDPVEVGDVGEVFPDEGVDGDGDEEMIEDELADYSPSHAGDEDGPVIEGDGDGDMEVDWLVNHLLESVFKGPELRASSSEVSKSFNLKFGGSEITCQVPQHALAETSGELLRPDLLYQSMKLELEELEAFGVGDVISETEARRSARESGRRVLTTRWVNSVKRPGLYRSRLVVRDYASMGGTTLAEGIYSPTTSLEGLKLLLALLCKRGSVLSCDVSVAFMHAAVSRPEYVELPSNVSIASSKGKLEKGSRVYLRLRKAMNGLRSAPLSWYQELSSYLRDTEFLPTLDPTIWRRKTSKGLVIVLFYVDDLLIYSEDSNEGRKFFEGLQKRYKLKLTGELLEDSPGEVSFFGRRVFRQQKGDRRVYFGLDQQYLGSCCEEFGITKPSPKLPSLEKRYYNELLKKGQTELVSPSAHERYRRTLGRLAWAALSRPDLQFICGFLGRHQAAPNEAAETCMRDVLKWVKGLPHKVQVFPSSREILEDDADSEAVSCFTDASWSLNSVSGGVITWENCALKSFSRKQTTTALSSAEAELAALTEVAREGLYIALLVETIREGIPQDREHGYYLLKGYSDSESAVCISKMSTLLLEVRHIELRAAFLQELVQRGRFIIEHIPGAINPADALTKSPTIESLASLYDCCGLVDEPQNWERENPKVSFQYDEPNSSESVSSTSVVSSSWKPGFPSGPGRSTKKKSH